MSPPKNGDRCRGVSTPRGLAELNLFATNVVDGIAFTLAEGDDGWRFVAWSDPDDYRWMPDPAERALARRFGTHTEALDYFRGICPDPTGPLS